MPSEMRWKWTERIGGIVGLVCTLVVTYIEIAQFLHRPEASVSGPPGAAKQMEPATMTPFPEWLLIMVGAIGLILLGTSWAMIILRAREKKRAVPPSSRQGPLEATDGADHDKLVQFITSALEPACWRLGNLQELLVEQTEGRQEIKELAKKGLFAEKAGTDFKAALTVFDGLHVSPQEAITLLALIDAVNRLESGGYVRFGRQLQVLERAAAFNPEIDPRTARAWKEWRASHDHLVEAFEVIKASSAFNATRYGDGFPSLYRPGLGSRWGEPYDFRYDPN